MIAASELPGPLDRDDVLGLLDHADDRRVPAGVTADPAGLLLGDTAADRAEPDLLLDLDEHCGEPAHVDGVGLEDVERDPLGALGADPWQPTELVDEVLDDAFVHQKPSVGLPCPGVPSAGSGAMSSTPRPGPVSRSSLSASGSSAWAAMASARARASRYAARIRSSRSSVSAGSKLFDRIFTLTSSPLPFSVTETRPSPTVPSTVRSASASCAAITCCCIACACSINEFRSRPAKGLLSLMGCLTLVEPAACRLAVRDLLDDLGAEPLGEELGAVERLDLGVVAICLLVGGSGRGGRDTASVGRLGGASSVGRRSGVRCSNRRRGRYGGWLGPGGRGAARLGGGVDDRLDLPL